MNTAEALTTPLVVMLRMGQDGELQLMSEPANVAAVSSSIVAVPPSCPAAFSFTDAGTVSLRAFALPGWAEGPPPLLQTVPLAEIPPIQPKLALTL
jgi:hypothetical protein